MSTYFLHDGRNELGPFTIDSLKKQALSRNTPIRQKDSNSWMPAEKIDVLKELVAPKKIKRPKDIFPVISEGFTHLKQTNPRSLYATLLGVVLLASFSIYSVTKTVANRIPVPISQVQPIPTVVASIAMTPAPIEEL